MDNENIYSEEDLKYLNPSAKREFLKCLKKYSRSLLDEAGRLETAIHSAGNDPEITSTHVKDADVNLGKGYGKQKKSKISRVMGIVLGVSGLIAGFLYKPESFNNPLSLNIFLVVFVIFFVSLAVQQLKD